MKKKLLFFGASLFGSGDGPINPDCGNWVDQDSNKFVNEDGLFIVFCKSPEVDNWVDQDSNKFVNQNGIFIVFSTSQVPETDFWIDQDQNTFVDDALDNINFITD